MANPRSEDRPEWEEAQKRTFTRWVNNHLKKRGYPLLHNVTGEFGDGIRLMQLVNSLYGVHMPAKYRKEVKTRVHKLDNLTLAFQMTDEVGIKFNFLQNEHLIDENQKMILGMLWAIILHFSISGINVENKSAKDGLLLWCKLNTTGYNHIDPPGLKGFTKDWSSGLPFCALIHKFRPDLIDYNALDPEQAGKNIDLAFTIAESLGIPRLMEADDLVNVPKPDERSVMTLVSEYFHYFSSVEMKEKEVEKVKKFLEFKKKASEVTLDYETRMRAVVEWLNQKIEYFLKGDFGDVDAIQMMKDYYRFEKPMKLYDDFEARTVYSALQNLMAVNGNPQYIAPPDLTFDAVDALWKRLADCESIFKGIDAMIQAYQSKIDSIRGLLDNTDQLLKKPANSAQDAELQVPLLVNAENDVESAMKDLEILPGLLGEIGRQEIVNNSSQIFDPHPTIEEISDICFRTLNDIGEKQHALRELILSRNLSDKQQDYETGANELREWLDDQILQLTYSSQDKIKDPDQSSQARELLADMDQEMDNRRGAREKLIRIYAEIQSDLVLNHREAYVPRDGLFPVDLGSGLASIAELVFSVQARLKHFDECERVLHLVQIYNNDASNLSEQISSQLRTQAGNMDNTNEDIKNIESALESFRHEKESLKSQVSDAKMRLADIQKECLLLGEDFPPADGLASSDLDNLSSGLDQCEKQLEKKLERQRIRKLLESYNAAASGLVNQLNMELANMQNTSDDLKDIESALVNFKAQKDTLRSQITEAKLKLADIQKGCSILGENFLPADGMASADIEGLFQNLNLCRNSCRRNMSVNGFGNLWTRIIMMRLI